MNESDGNYGVRHEDGQDGVEHASSRSVAYVILALACLTGLSSFLAWLVFIFQGSLDLARLGLSETGVIGLDTGLSILFFIVHSGMIRSRFRRWLGGFVREEFHGALYTIVSGATLLATVILWQESALVVVSPPVWARWGMHVIFALCFFGFFLCMRAFDSFDMYGTAPLSRLLRGEEPPAEIPFTVSGPYRWVRHPFYLFCIILIWSGPDLTSDRLLYNFLWTAWVIVGAILEERDLVARFGEEYRDYQKKVPMLFPRGVRPAVDKKFDNFHLASKRHIKTSC